MTALSSKNHRRDARGFVLIRSSAAVAVTALAIGATVWIEHESTTPNQPGNASAPPEVTPWNALDAQLPMQVATAPPETADAAATPAWPTYDGPPVQDWKEIEAQLPRANSQGLTALADPLATP